MKDLSEDQREVKRLALKALEHYYGVMGALKRRTVALLQRYSFSKFGKGLGLKLPRAVKPVLGPEHDLLYSKPFRDMVTCVIRQSGPDKSRQTLKRLSRFLEIPKSTLISWCQGSCPDNSCNLC